MMHVINWAVGSGCALLLAANSLPVAPEASEYEVKAAFLYNFSKFVDWPEEAFSASEAPLEICVLGDNPFGGTLVAAVRDKQVNGRQISVRHVPSVGETRGCHIAFIHASESRRLEQILDPLRRTPTLTVSDMPSFAERGGVIGLKVDKKRVRFEVNMVAAREAGLKLSSQLLKVATAVIGQLGENP